MNYIRITSPSNPKIKEVLDIKNRRSKYKGNVFIIEGPHLTEMALASGIGMKEVFFTGAFATKKEGQRLLRQLLKKSNVIPAKPVIQKTFFQEHGATSGLDSSLRGNDELEIEIFEVTEQILKKLTDTETPQGIVAIVSYATKNPDDIIFRSTPMLVIADGVREPGNLGTIIRTSDAAGADAVVILKGTCDAFSQKTIRSTAGSLFNIPIIHSETAKLLSWLKINKIQLAATALDSEKSVFDADLTFPTAFVFGNEAHGISNQMRKNSDLILKIPIHGKAESLNVSAAAAVCLYEAVRQRISVSG